MSGFNETRTKASSDNWRTPPALVRAVGRRLGVRFVFDAACTSRDAVCVNGAYWPAFDGRREDWAPRVRGRRRGAVWCNPPYSDCAGWLEACARNGARVPVAALVPARTDTKYFHDHVMGGFNPADVVLLMRGRVPFINPATGRAQAGGNFPSAVYAWLPQMRRVGAPQIVTGWDWREGLS